MFEFIAEVKSENDHLHKVCEALKDLKSREVLVGIPQTESPRDGEVSNADLLFIHSNGSPLKGIPPRPVIEPAIVDDKEIIGDLLKTASQKAMAGDSEGMVQSLEKAGMRGENVAKTWFTNPKNGWAPNNPLTVKLKGSSRPLVDTGEMRKSITHVVRKK